MPRTSLMILLETFASTGQLEHPFPVRIRARQGNCRGREGTESIAHPGSGGGYPTPQDPCIQAAITARWRKPCLTRMALTSGMINDSLATCGETPRGQIGFRYDGEWLTQGGFAVSHTLPLRNFDPSTAKMKRSQSPPARLNHADCLAYDADQDGPVSFLLDKMFRARAMIRPETG